MPAGAGTSTYLVHPLRRGVNCAELDASTDGWVGKWMQTGQLGAFATRRTVQCCCHQPRWQPPGTNNGRGMNACTRPASRERPSAKCSKGGSQYGNSEGGSSHSKVIVTHNTQQQQRLSTTFHGKKPATGSSSYGDYVQAVHCRCRQPAGWSTWGSSRLRDVCAPTGVGRRQGPAPDTSCPARSNTGTRFPSSCGWALHFGCPRPRTWMTGGRPSVVE